MGSQVGPALFSIAGTAVGSYFGGPIGGAIGGLAGGVVGSLIFGNGNRAQPMLQLMQSSFGRPIPIIWGTVRLGGTMIWRSDVNSHGGGLFGKGGSGTTQYQESAAIAFCQGPASLVKVWTDGNLFADLSTGSFVSVTKNNFNIVWYDGDENQQINPAIQAWVNEHVAPPACPAYRGLAYLHCEGVSLFNYGNRFPSISAVVSKSATPTTVFLHFQPLSPDVSSDVTVSQGDGSQGFGPVVDWIRNVAYQLSLDGTLRMFDLSSGQCLQAKTQAALFANVPTVNPAPVVGLTDPQPVTIDATHPGPSAMACSQGGYLYLTQGIGGGAHGTLSVWTVDPDSLTLLYPQVIQAGLGYDDFPGWIQAFSIASSSGVGAGIDYLVGRTILGDIFIVDPVLGLYIGGITLPGNAETDVSVTVERDALGNMTSLYFFSNGPEDYTIYISKLAPYDIALAANAVGAAVLEGTVPTGFGTVPLYATLAWPQFGLSGPISGIFSAAVCAICDPGDGTIIISSLASIGFGRTIKWSLATGTIWTSSYLPPPTSFPMPYAFITNGQLGSWDDTIGQWVLLNTADGSVTISPRNTGDPESSSSSIAYNGLTNAVVIEPGGGGDPLYVAYLGRNSTANVNLADVITDICGMVAVTPEMIDVTLVTQQIAGYAITDTRSAGSALQDLCSTFQIDMVESDYLLKFVPRGQAVVATLTQADLASIDSADSGKFWEVKRAQEQEMPLQINVAYPDPYLDFQAGSAYAKRTALPVQTQFSKRKKTVTLSVVMDNQQATQVAQSWLYTIWAERSTYETVLPMQYLWLDPTDNISVALDDGDVYTVRIESAETGADYSMKMSLASEDLSTYAPSPAPGAQYGAEPQTLSVSPFAQLLQFNVPLLQDGDDTGGSASRIYLAAGAYSPGWLSGVVYKSTDGTSYPSLATLPSAANWGRAQNALGDTVSPSSTDNVNTLTVSLVAGSTPPSSISYLAMMNGANAALLGEEIIQFQTVVDNPDGTLTLSGLGRGLRGTEWATETHAAGDLFVLLQGSLVSAQLLPLSQINQAEFWKLVPSGQALDAARVTSFVYRGYDLMPYAPVGFSRTPSGSDLVFAWNRRTRIGGTLTDGTDLVALNEETEAYEAYLIASDAARGGFSAATPASYVRAFTGLTTPTVTYTAAMMTADGFNPATQTAFLVVYQLSAVVGRGFPGYQALPAF